MSWDDQPLPEDAEIKAAFPTRSGRHDLYQEAMRLVGACHSKGRLVEMVNMLLHRNENLLGAIEQYTKDRAAQVSRKAEGGLRW